MTDSNFFKYLPSTLRMKIKQAVFKRGQDLLEIRLRVKQPVEIITRSRDLLLREAIVTREDLENAMLLLTENSLYALERQLREGFITIEGGHRVGFTGEVIVNGERIEKIKNVNSINYRLSEEVIGAGEGVIDYLYDSCSDYVYNTLIISPPICGKTTLLRDLVRILSDVKGKKVGVVDERSEIAGAYKGIARNNIGIRTDLLDNCPKSEGMLLLIRAMSPEVIAVDEIGKEKDIKAIGETVNAGVSLLTTVHGKNLQSVKMRPGLRELIDKYIFRRFVVLSKRSGVGTVEGIFDHRGENLCG